MELPMPATVETCKYLEEYPDNICVVCGGVIPGCSSISKLEFYGLKDRFIKIGIYSLKFGSTPYIVAVDAAIDWYKKTLITDGIPTETSKGKDKDVICAFLYKVIMKELAK